MQTLNAPQRQCVGFPVIGDELPAPSSFLYSAAACCAVDDDVIFLFVRHASCGDYSSMLRMRLVSGWRHERIFIIRDTDRPRGVREKDFHADEHVHNCWKKNSCDHNSRAR
jgi:hypothetical protein